MRNHYRLSLSVSPQTDTQSALANCCKRGQIEGVLTFCDITLTQRTKAGTNARWVSKALGRQTQKSKKTLCEHPPAERNPHCFDLNPFVQQTFVKENI